MLRVVDMCFDYGNMSVLDGIEAAVERGKILSIAGPNGTGKTTLLKCMARIIQPSRGTVLIDELDTRHIARMDLARRLAYVPQHLPARFCMTVFETVLTGRRPHFAWGPAAHDMRKTAAILQELNLAELAMRDINQLSGGQVQKVLLARALAQEPDYLLLDEPTSSLDLYHQLEVMEIIAGLVREKEVGAVIAMHDLNLAARFSDTVMMIKAGRVYGTGTPAELISPNNIRTVYGVEAVVRQENGHLYIQPLRCANGAAALSQ